MRPRGKSFSTFRTLLHLTAFLVLIGFVSPLPAAEQGTGAAATTPTATGQITQTATGLVLEQMIMSRLMLNGEQYFFNGNTRFYGIDGKPMKRHELKPGSIVNVEYVTGGPKTEEWPFNPSDRVLTIVRLVATAKR